MGIKAIKVTGLKKLILKIMYTVNIYRIENFSLE